MKFRGPWRNSPWLWFVTSLALLTGGPAGCFGPGLLTDGTSVSFGSFNAGALRGGTKLPPHGKGYVVPALWEARGANYTTDEFAAAIQRVGRRVASEYPGSILGVADMSLRGGGESKLHRSHENGRDADLLFFARDTTGKILCPGNCMPRYDGRFRARPPRETEGVLFDPVVPSTFDVPRNWALVRALLQDPDIEIQYLFCHNRLREAMLEHARNIGESDELIDQAEALLRQPGDSLPHDDHLHVRIYCASTDRPFGCRDAGPLRWWKKRYKYMPPAPPHLPADREVARLFMSRYFDAAARLR